jgi:hypothetical protein
MRQYVGLGLGIIAGTVIGAGAVFWAKKRRALAFYS